MEIKERIYGIDLLRLISMYMVVTLHVLGHGAVLKNVTKLSATSEAIWILEIACYSAVNIFALISGFVGYKSKYKYTSIINLILQYFFYTILVTFIELLMCLLIEGNEFNKPLMACLCPKLWYFSEYLILFFFIPFLNCILEISPRKILRIAALVIIIQLFDQNFIGYNRGYSVSWLVILYVVGGYLAKYNVLGKWSKRKCLLGYVVCIIFTEISRICYLNNHKKIFFFSDYKFTLISYTSPTIILSAVFLVCFFSKIKFRDKYIKLISILAPLSFGVYLIHEQPFIRNSIIKESFSFIASRPFYLAVALALASSFLIFICCLFIEYLRSCLFKALNIKKFSELLEKWISRFFTLVLKF